MQHINPEQLKPDAPAVPQLVGSRRKPPATDPRQRQRLHNFARICLLPLGYLSVLYTFYLCNLIDQRVIINAIAIFAAGSAAIFGLFYSRVNLQADDKNLTAFMAACMILAMLWILYEAPATRMIFVPCALLVMMLSAFRLRQSVLLMMAVGTLAGFAATIALQYLQSATPIFPLLDVLQLLVLALTLPGFIVLGRRMRHLHRALYKASIKIEHVQEDARRDALTGSYNRRYMMSALQQQKQLADDSDDYLCLAVIDLDHFKRINDEVGHLAGDEVLRTFARVAQQHLRKEDVFGRYGGEEFLLLMPSTILLDALNIVERIRDLSEAQLWISAKLRQKATVSIGVTQYIPGESILDLFSRADAAMYLAKTGGRNQVVVEEPVELVQ
ncbi:MAG TPA: GGDEF domain-containing protein [Burkholderiaceae bacterium]|nr:GGDEF domain-containing protein [Burkholderiaceae bacterium]